MGVPAFFRWLSEKYPRTVIDMVEQRPRTVEGVTIPVDATQSNPNEMEFDNLYIDMNGIIHPCSHPEDRPAPNTEEEMFHNVMMYVDRIFAAVRPRKLLFLAVDGVAPRAKMNQQRTRRFRAAGDAKERHEIKQQTRREMIELGLPVPPEELDKEWDSNVITPGTQFMTNLAKYIRYYISDRVNNNKAWQSIQVIFSDGSEPGEGEHKIMDYIRRQRSQAGYDPNIRHILHGLDADLIMLALATHEPHFTILREQVLFGRRAKEEGSRKTAAQEAYDQMTGQNSDYSEHIGFPYMKPFQMLHVPILREYLQEEFRVLQTVPFGYDFERIVDDFVFLCFFVGNDFLPHLPSLDIRDGAIDFLINVYKRVLPAMGGYLTNSGGEVNLEKVDIILAEVGRVEDEVFRRRRSAEQRDRARFDSRVRQVEGRYGGSAQEIAQRVVPEDIRPLGKSRRAGPGDGPPALSRGASQQSESSCSSMGSEKPSNKNAEAAQVLRESLRKSAELKRRRAEEKQEGGEESGGGVSGLESPLKRTKLEGEGGGEVHMQPGDETAPAVEAEALEAEVANGTSDVGDTSAEPEEETPMLEEDEDPLKIPVVVPPELEGTELAEAQAVLAARVKAKHEAKLDRLRDEVQDTIQLHLSGWKERYYKDKLKKQNVESGGGQEKMFQTYIEGLCWVYQYYYRGCPSWNWYYPFHYAPFASDLVNIDRYKIEFEQGTPFRPIEQLMAVLPPESSDALPVPFAKLMTDPNSPIKDFYPDDVEIDPNGKHLPWLWVTLLPFIDEKKLLETVRSLEDELSEMERVRNSFGPSLLYTFETHPLGKAMLSVEQSEDESVRVILLASEHGGFSGTLTKAPASALLKLGGLIIAPKQPLHVFHDIESNRALVASYELPPAAPHHSFLLAGVIIPPPKLTARDLAPRRPPRLGKGGINIADLGSQLGYGDVPAPQRMVMHGMGLNMGQFQGGGGGYQQPYHQQQTGNMSWGTLEPQNQKQPRFYPPMPPGPPPRQPLYGAPLVPPRGPALFPGGLPPPRLMPPMPPGAPYQPPMPHMPPMIPANMAPFTPGLVRPPLWPPHPRAPLFPQAPPLIPSGPTPDMLNSIRQQVAAAIQQRNAEGQTGVPPPGMLMPPRGGSQGGGRHGQYQHGQYNR